MLLFFSFSGIYPNFILTQPKMSTVSWKSRLILKTKKKSKKKRDNFTCDDDEENTSKRQKVDNLTSNND